MLLNKETNVLLIKSQHGVNMVDLMMWLVIASLLLAAVIQGIGYYQKASWTYQAKSDLSGAHSWVGARVATTNDLPNSVDMQQALNDGELSFTGNNDDMNLGLIATNGSYYCLGVQATRLSEDNIFYSNSDAPSDIKRGSSLPAECGDVTTITPPGEASDGNNDAVPSSPIFENVQWEKKGNVAASWYGFATTANGSTIYATKGANDYPQRSLDGGNTWSNVTALGQAAYNSVAVSDDGRIVVAGSQNGRLKISADSGSTWNNTTAGNRADGQGAWYSASTSASGQFIIAGDYNSGLWLSKDYGSTWIRQSNGAPNSATWVSATISDDGTKIAVGTLAGIYTSVNTGATWVRHLGTAESGQWYAITSSADGNTLYAARENGAIYKSEDAGNSWMGLPSPSSQWRSLAISKDGQRVAAGTFGNGLYTSKEGGTDWHLEETPGNGPWYGIAMSADGGKLFTGRGQGFLYLGSYGG